MRASLSAATVAAIQDTVSRQERERKGRANHDRVRAALNRAPRLAVLGFWQRSRPCPGHLKVVEL